MPDTDNNFHGCWPALMTPCRADLSLPDYDALVRTARTIVEAGNWSLPECPWRWAPALRGRAGPKQKNDLGIIWDNRAGK